MILRTIIKKQYVLQYICDFEGNNHKSISFYYDLRVSKHVSFLGRCVDGQRIVFFPVILLI